MEHMQYTAWFWPSGDTRIVSPPTPLTVDGIRSLQSLLPHDFRHLPVFEVSKNKITILHFEEAGHLTWGFEKGLRFALTWTEAGASDLLMQMFDKQPARTPSLPWVIVDGQPDDLKQFHYAITFAMLHIVEGSK